MAHNLNTSKPLGGLDFDSSDLTINHGPGGGESAYQDYRYAKNLRTAINSANRGDSLTNIMSMVQPTKYTLPYSNNIFPAGENQCIGAYEDTKYNTVIFFVWNSNNNHQILRYYRNNTDPLNPFGEIQQVIMYAYAWEQTTRITSMAVFYGDPTNNGAGDLLYWCDPVPHKINLTKGNICYKQKSWNIYFPQTNIFTQNTFPTLILKDINNNIVLDAQIALLAAPDNATGIQVWVNSLNTNFGHIITATTCDCFVTITEVGTNSFYYSLTGGFDVPFPTLMVALNWYGSALTYRMFDRCKYPPLFSPQALYEQDPKFLPNYVQNHVFRFRLGYDYDDLEPSVLGVYSQIPINNLQCDGTDNITYNYIDVNFNDPNLLDVTVLNILEKIEFVAASIDSSTGTWNPDQLVQILTPCDFLDWNGTNLYCHFKFYNNILATTIDPDRIAQLYDDVPLESNAQIGIKNLMTEGGVTTGYNAPDCAAAKANIVMQPTPQQKLYKVTFNVAILTYGLLTLESNNLPGSRAAFSDFYNATGVGKYPYWHVEGVGNIVNQYRGGIFYDSLGAMDTGENIPFFGGGMFGANQAFSVREDMLSLYDQRIPEGWIVYAAGTQYWASGKQIEVGLSNSNGVLDVSTPQLQAAIEAYFGSGTNFTNTIYSTVSVMVPAGEYIFRMPSHWCSRGDILGKGFAYDLNGTYWQNTSTNVCGVVGPSGMQWELTKEIQVTVNEDQFAGTFVVMDLSPPVDANITGNNGTCAWKPFNGYLYDSFDAINGFSSDPNSPDYNGVSVELSAAFWDIFEPVPEQRLNWNSGQITDHNGYFFGISKGFGSTGGQPNTFSSMQVYQVNETAEQAISLSSVIYNGTISDLVNKTLQPYSLGSGSFQQSVATGLIAFIIPTTAATGRNNSSSFLSGNIEDNNGNAINGVTVVAQNGRTAVTDANGQYNLLIWGDMFTPNITNFPNGQVFTSGTSRSGEALFSLLILCLPTYPNGQTKNFNLESFGPNPAYNPTNPYLMGAFIIIEGTTPAVKARKRGGNYIDVIKFYDAPGRFCTCTELYQLYLPFETEDLHQYSQVLDGVPTPGNPYGNPFSVPTFMAGKPTIYWTLGPNFKPPAWASYYQLMRSKNLTYGRYLQWAANQVTYVAQIASSTGAPEVDTSFQNGNATAIKISLDNIITYKQENDNSTIGYTFEAGDRLRLMYDRGLNLIKGLYDFEITSQDTEGNIYIKYESNLPFEISSGFIVEVYNVNSLSPTDTQLYYEVGEVYTCTNPGNANNDFSVKTGAFTNGDTYWRGRSILVNDTVTDFATVYPIIIEDASVSDFYESETGDEGRIGTIDPTFIQLYQPTTLLASDTYLPGTGLNGLSTFDPNTEQSAEIDRRYGAIQRLFFEQNNLIAICSSKEVSNYIDRETLYQAQAGTGVIATSGDFFGTQFIHAQNLGTDLPATCVTNSGLIYGWTNIRANVWKYQGDGEGILSDVKAITWFKQLSIDGVSDAVAVYDRYHEEYIITYWRNHSDNYVVSIPATIPNPTTFVQLSSAVEPTVTIGANVTLQFFNSAGNQQIAGTIASITEEVIFDHGVEKIVWLIVVNFATPGNYGLVSLLPVKLNYSLPETISWFEGTGKQKTEGIAQRWKTFYDFTPENYCSLGSEVISFVNGKPWLHDAGVGYNNFYGKQYSTLVSPVFNGRPITSAFQRSQQTEPNKVWNALWLKGTQQDGNCGWYAPSITNFYGQQSRLNAANWKEMENNFSTDFKRDLTDTTAGPYPIINGRVLRSEALTVNMRNDYTGEIVLYELQANFTLSERTSK